MAKRITVITGIAFAVAAVALALSMAGCAERYRVDYDGHKDWYKGAKDSYPAGAEVRLVYDGVATDTDYWFYLDGETLDWEFDGDHSFIITFTMPAHDVTLHRETRNSMEYDPDADWAQGMHAAG